MIAPLIHKLTCFFEEKTACHIEAASADWNIELIETVLNPLIKKIRIPRGTVYAIRRGRGRFIVEPVDLTA